MTDVFKGYVTVTELSPAGAKSSVELIETACRKSCERKGILPAGPRKFHQKDDKRTGLRRLGERCRTAGKVDQAARADFRSRFAASFRSSTKRSYSRALASSSGSRS